MNKCTNAVVLTAAAYTESRLPRLHPSISSSLYVLEQCFWIMFGRDISLVFRRRKERLMFVIKLCCVDVMALHGGGEKENDGSSQQEQQ